MTLGYYWARRGDTWRIVEVVRGLHGAVLEGGYSVPVAEFSEFEGPLSHDDEYRHHPESNHTSGAIVTAADLKEKIDGSVF